MDSDQDGSIKPKMGITCWNFIISWDVKSGVTKVYTWTEICDAVRDLRSKEDTQSSQKLWLLNSLAMNLKMRPRSNRIINIYRFRDAEIFPYKFQTSSENKTKNDSTERELAVNIQHMIDMIRLRNHAGHPSKAKQKGDAHLLDIETHIQCNIFT